MRPHDEAEDDEARATHLVPAPDDKIDAPHLGSETHVRSKSDGIDGDVCFALGALADSLHDLLQLDIGKVTAQDVRRGGKSDQAGARCDESSQPIQGEGDMGGMSGVREARGLPSLDRQVQALGQAQPRTSVGFMVD